MIGLGTPGVATTPSAIDGLLALVSDPEAMKVRLAELQAEVERANAAKAEADKARKALASEQERLKTGLADMDAWQKRLDAEGQRQAKAAELAAKHDAALKAQADKLLENAALAAEFQAKLDEREADLNSRDVQLQRAGAHVWKSGWS
jgi:cell pole-organizing protein PopZ